MDINIREPFRVYATGFSLPYQTIYNQNYRHNSGLDYVRLRCGISSYVENINDT